MEYTHSSQNQIMTYHLKGRLIGEYDGTAITEAVSNDIANGTSHFILDLRELEHVNSVGLGVMVTLLTKARKAGGELALASPSPIISSMLMITKLNTIFKVFTTLDEAQKTIGN